MKGALCLLILLIIYIPITYLIIKIVKKKVVKITLIALAILLSPILSLIIWFNIPYYYLAPFEGKVIDADTRQPIEGAAVLAVYYKTVYTIAGSNSYPEDAQETMTDKNGEFKIAEITKWSWEQKGYPEGHIVIFKPGYGVFPDHRRTIAVGVDSGWWPPPGKYIVYELPKLKTREERKDNLIFSRPDIPYKKMRNFINLINEEYSTLGLPGISIPKKER